MLAGSLEIRDEYDMDIKRVMRTDFATDLTDRFDKRLAFDVTDRTADLGDDDIRLGFQADVIDEFFDLIGDVRDRLYGRTQIFAAAFFGEYRGVYFTCRKVREFI